MIAIILHSKWETESVALVNSIPEDQRADYVIIEWLGDHAVPGHVCACVNGQPYAGPDPSAFPELVWFDQDSSSWVRIRAATGLEKDLSKVDARKEVE